MKLMFSFEGTYEEFERIVGNTIHTRVEEISFSNRQFDVSPNVWYDLAYHHRPNEIAGRAFTDSRGDIKLDMIDVHRSLEGLLGRVILTLSYGPADIACHFSHLSPAGQEYVMRTGDSELRELHGIINSNSK